DTLWLERAKRQVQLTRYRLTFRNFFYPGKGQLPLPPEQLWEIELDAAGPVRVATQGHDLILLNYTFSSTLLTDLHSPGIVEPALAEIGGRWQEPFILPFDPELLLQRTDNACVNEGGFPPHSFDSENAWQFYDHTCLADSAGPTGCHRDRLPAQSCVEALASHVGWLETAVEFERLAWDATLADQVRVEEVVEGGADLAVVAGDLADNRVIYRYFEPDSCAIVEQCVGGAGWRRLLQFSATVHNLGGQALHIGTPAEDPEHNLFQYNACHDHFHFSDYGDFIFGADALTNASKQAFCVESTGRRSNNEASPLYHDYTCRFQGIQAGWVDEYQAGLECQWIDITDVEGTQGTEGTEEGEFLQPPEFPSSYYTATLSFNSNTDGFLCEGTPVVDENGVQLWEASGLVDEEGQPIERPQCAFVPEWDRNNQGAYEMVVAAEGSFVTEACGRQHFGPRRNCGFSPQVVDVTLPEESLFGSCQPDRPVRLTCRVEDATRPMVLRICETSAVLGAGLACVYQEALANETIDAEGVEVSFSCPAARDEQEPGGRYAFYTGPVYPQDEPQVVSCQTP
ncbi:MAG: lysyl oxidase family protein, partial [Chloroflexota bacterium]